MHTKRLMIFLALLCLMVGGAKKAAAVEPCPCHYTYLYDGVKQMKIALGVNTSPLKQISGCWETGSYVEVATQFSDSCFMYMSTYKPKAGACYFSVFCTACPTCTTLNLQSVPITLTADQVKSCRDELLIDVKHGLQFCETGPSPFNP